VKVVAAEPEASLKVLFVLFVLRTSIQFVTCRVLLLNMLRDRRRHSTRHIGTIIDELLNSKRLYDIVFDFVAGYLF